MLHKQKTATLDQQTTQTIKPQQLLINQLSIEISNLNQLLINEQCLITIRSPPTGASPFSQKVINFQHENLENAA